MNCAPVRSAIIPFFIAFRLIYIPASILTHTGHGQPWLTAALGWAATFGGEWLTRRIAGDPSLRERRRGLAVVMLALILLGFFPEEAPIGLILWAGIGAAWGVATRGQGSQARQMFIAVGAVTLGALLGASGFFGPGSWIAAAVLGPVLWHRRGS